MPYRPSSRRAVEIIWQSITQPSIDPEPALDALQHRFESGSSVMEYFAGQFYHLARGAYIAISHNDTDHAAEGFNDAARFLMHDVMAVIDGTTYHRRITDFYGVANELTPAAIAPLYLSSREDDLYKKTDLYLSDEGVTIPVQMKTDECYTIADAPKGGALVTAKDFGNEDFAISRAVILSERMPSHRNSAKLKIARQALVDCIHRRASDPELQRRELAIKSSSVRGPKFKKSRLRPIYQHSFATEAMNELAQRLAPDTPSS